MAATDARLIVLATVLDQEPVTGYAVRKHLLDQGAGTWGGLSVASIYSVLRTLTKHGWLEELDDPTGVRSETKAYRATAAGRKGFDDLWTSAVETIDPSRPLAFNVAITLTALVTREQFVGSLERRLEQLDERLALPAPVAGPPPQVRNAIALWRGLAETEAGWVRSTLEHVAGDPERFGFLSEST